MGDTERSADYWDDHCSRCSDELEAGRDATLCKECSREIEMKRRERGGRCERCDGHGYIYGTFCDLQRAMNGRDTLCPECHGSGRVPYKPEDDGGLVPDGGQVEDDADHTECAICGYEPDRDRVPPPYVLSLSDEDADDHFVQSYPFGGSLSVPFACSDECWLDAQDDPELVTDGGTEQSRLDVGDTRKPVAIKDAQRVTSGDLAALAMCAHLYEPGDVAGWYTHEPEDVIRQWITSNVGSVIARLSPHCEDTRGDLPPLHPADGLWRGEVDTGPEQTELITDGGRDVAGTYRVTLDNPAANTRTHVQVDADDRRDARRRAKREYPRHVVQRVRSVDSSHDTGGDV